MEPLILSVVFAIGCLALGWSMITARRIRRVERALEIRQVGRSTPIEIEDRRNSGRESPGQISITELQSQSEDTKRRRIDAAQFPGPTFIEVPDLTYVGSQEQASTSAAELSDRFRTIQEMADAGESPANIALRLGRPLGQIELILGLRREINALAVDSSPQEPKS